MVPCHNRPADVRGVLDDLLRLSRLGHDIEVTVIDNASYPPIPPDLPDGLAGRVIRRDVNAGGSGGFNAGLAHLLAAPPPSGREEFLWLIDSDARLPDDPLGPLLDALRAHPDLAAAGSVLADPKTRAAYEAGGIVSARTGEYVPAPLPAPAPDIVPCDYLAACSLLVRRRAVERAGLMPDVFVNGDDVGWGCRLREATGQALAAVPASIVLHPNPDRMRTWSRYYAARNAPAALAAAGLGSGAVLTRSLREVARALGQVLVGAPDLAELHLAGLRDAARGLRTGPAPRNVLRFHALRPWSEWRGEGGLGREEMLARAAELRGGAAGAVFRLLVPVRPRRAVVSARGRPADAGRGMTVIAVAPEGFSVRRLPAGRTISLAARTAARGAWLALRLGLRPPEPVAGAPVESAGAPLTLAVVILSFNRRDSLVQTLSRLAEMLAPGQGVEARGVIVVDNASSDGSAPAAEEAWGRAGAPVPIRVVSMETNSGVAGFNAGARVADADALLILDDDARPEPAALRGALELLARRRDVDAVALHPVHPRTRRSEWPFARDTRDDWPLMGCANVVRRSAWARVGGYDEAFFLYRNDTDLALKILGSGGRVRFDPGWIAWHDSPAARHKAARWFELATRNWVWLARRHGRGPARAWGALAGWAWAHRLAGVSLRSHTRVLRGVFLGVTRAPTAFATAGARGLGWRTMLSIRFGGALRGRMGRAPAGSVTPPAP